MAEVAEPFPNHYATLGLKYASDLDFQAVRTAYKKKSLIHHPDHGGNVTEFVNVHAAYQALSDPQLKERYDDEYRVWYPADADGTHSDTIAVAPSIDANITSSGAGSANLADSEFDYTNIHFTDFTYAAAEALDEPLLERRKVVFLTRIEQSLLRDYQAIFPHPELVDFFAISHTPFVDAVSDARIKPYLVHMINARAWDGMAAHRTQKKQHDRADNTHTVHQGKVARRVSWFEIKIMLESSYAGWRKLRRQLVEDVIRDCSMLFGQPMGPAHALVDGVGRVVASLGYQWASLTALHRMVAGVAEARKGSFDGDPEILRAMRFQENMELEMAAVMNRMLKLVETSSEGVGRNAISVVRFTAVAVADAKKEEKLTVAMLEELRNWPQMPED
ncbi:unnamed protein product [Discula destructiva]